MSKIKFFALGGLGENGKNMYVCEVDESIFILDAGLKYPSVDMLGVDSVYPSMEYLEETLGEGWWGSEKYADYYEQLEGENNPFNWIKVIPTMSTEVQNATGYDHAGKYETSMLMSLYPDCVDLTRLGDIKHWFTTVI